TTTAKCGIAGHNSAVGGITSTAISTKVKDTEAGAKLACSVTPSGDGFNAVGTIQQGAERLDFQIFGISPTKPGTGKVSFSSPKTAGLYESAGAKPCTFTKSKGGEVDS